MIEFIYKNAEGVESTRVYERWEEVGYYLKCYEESGAVRTFRKDRVVQYLNGIEAQLVEPSPPPPPRPQSDRAREDRPQIVFTGFAQAIRDQLEHLADAGGLDVRKSVTQGLMFLCGGPNAGPKKLEKAMAQRVYILDEAQFQALLETGELPA
ncbi:hypothetical protein [Pigmentiphaga sp. CHJ604]|uniref:hypothetical protein n=1 Tax=Pigmentiphaga sp. CHJ604 TaxID=3081984 RepID=UPI0030CDC7E2